MRKAAAPAGSVVYIYDLPGQSGEWGFSDSPALCGRLSGKEMGDFMGIPSKIIIGSRESKLAVLQSIMLGNFLREKYPDTELVLDTMKTTGDIILDKPLENIGGKGLFLKELEKALLEKRIDVCVHSLKDVPMEVVYALPIVGYSQREDPRDVLVLPRYDSEIDFSKPIGCGSRRRIIQLEKIFPQAEFKGIRGNVLTRLKKLDEGEYGALILAAAGLKRMGLEDRISRYFDIDEVIPCAGQGILAVQGRREDDYSYLEEFNSIDSTAAALAERAFVRYLNGGCTSPIAAHAQVLLRNIKLTGLYYSEEKDEYITGEIKGDTHEAEILGFMLAKQLKAKLDG